MPRSASARAGSGSAEPGAPYVTKQELVYRSLRDAIMRCELAPGQRLVIDELARRLHVSAIPVREALHLLGSERLIVNVPHVGATVAPIEPDSVHEVFTVMEGLETVAAREAAARLDAGEAAELALLVRVMDEAAREEDYAEWSALNTRFHLAIAGMADMPLLRDMTERALSHWDRIRRHFFEGVLVRRVATAQREHHEILGALQAKDVPRLEDAVRRHNRGALQDYTRYMREHRDAAAAPRRDGQP
jgi:DNA-binding GntR family transcriptional regulator